MALRVLILRDVPPEVAEALRRLPGAPEILPPVEASSLLDRIAADRPEILVGPDGILDAAASPDLDETIEREFSRAVRYRHPLAVVVVAVDGIAAMRDTHGAPAVEGYLASLEDALRRSLRQIDIVRRLGADRFVGLLPETPAEGARVAATRLRGIASRLLVKPGIASRPALPIKATAGIGYADVPREEIASGRRLLEVACAAAARAQREGGDRVVPPSY